MRQVTDTVILGLPPHLDPSDPEVVVRLHDVAEHTVRSQSSSVVYTDITAHWTFATTPEQVEAWPLPHDCDSCRDGRDKAIAALRDATDQRQIALGRLTYTEHRIR